MTRYFTRSAQRCRLSPNLFKMNSSDMIVAEARSHDGGIYGVGVDVYG